MINSEKKGVSRMERARENITQMQSRTWKTGVTMRGRLVTNACLSRSKSIATLSISSVVIAER